ncbi:MAG: hypothetical protein ACR2HY_11380 [Acidimicrobiales bacterium]
MAVRDHDVELPRGRELEVRAPGLWAQLICETPLDHWSAGLEASAIALDDSAAVTGDERGDPTALGLDLEWEVAGRPATVAGSAGYAQPAAVYGDVLVGAERLTVAGTGWYSHRWGIPPWPDASWWSVFAHLGDGTAIATSAPGRASTWRDGEVHEGDASLGSRWPPGPEPEPGPLLVVNGIGLPMTATAVALVPLGAAAADQVLVRSLCSLGDDHPAGGHGWAEWLASPCPASP